MGQAQPQNAQQVNQAGENQQPNQNNQEQNILINVELPQENIQDAQNQQVQNNNGDIDLNVQNDQNPDNNQPGNPVNLADVNVDQEQQPNVEEEEEDDSSSEEEKENVDPKMGCKHYRRKCQLECPTCLKFYTCRFCHDEINYEQEFDPQKNHQIDRHSVKRIKCLACDHIQKTQSHCENCSIQFAHYFCKKCNLFDNEAERKKIFHCDGCGICRCGGRDQAFHCDICQACMSIEAKNNHICMKDKLKQNCPFCLEYMFVSRKSTVTVKCGHCMHYKCLKKYLKKGYQTACPLCKKSMFDPLINEEYMDQQVLFTQMPEAYSNKTMKILCNDCLNKSIVPFHILPGKCKSCRSYNTTRTEEMNEEVINDPVQLNSQP